MTLTPGPAPAALSETRRVVSGNALGAASMITWAAGFPAAEVLLASWPQTTMLLVRFGLAAAVLMSFWLLSEGPGPLRRAPWMRGLSAGALMFGGSGFLLLKAQVLTDPVTVALISTTAPVIGMLLEMAGGSRKPGVRFALGVAATVAGGMVATSGSGGGAEFGFGALMALGAIALYTWGSLEMVRGLPGLSLAGRATLTVTGGFAVFAVIAAVQAAAGQDLRPAAPVDAAQIQMMLIYALAAVALSQALWVASVERLGVALASFHINLSPFYVMVLMLALGAGWHWPQAFGAAIVGIGVVISQDRRR